MKKLSVQLAVLVIVGLGHQARANFLFYTSRADFDAATTGNTIIDYSGLAPANGFAYFGNPGMLNVGGVTFETPNGPLFVQNDGTTSRLTYQQGVPIDVLDVTLPTGTTAVGFDYEAGFGLTLTFASGESFELPVVGFPNFDFVGFTSDQPIGSFRLERGGDLENFTFGRAVQAVPEPAGVVMLGTGVVGVLSLFRRRRSKPWDKAA